MLIGRDFLRDHRISILINPVEEKVRLFSEIASVDILNNSLENPVTSSLNIKTDFDSIVTEKLIATIQEVEKTKVPVIDDNYTVKVSLKDDSIYAYAPRKFAWTERLQIREITDDLLNRNIIKYSASPYCARVVPVRKKNGKIRLCIDLRPLNSRIIKQKYPLPLIEDCLSRLSNKSIFSFLDLKDGFHHIKIHPDHTKYFAFATPDGQFEYIRLPFGFCEAPAEFQKRIVQILQPLIREDKIIVYIDDILIPSSSIEDNLSVLKQVMLLLKRHEFQLNYDKCLFLRTTIEYLGYIISPAGITLSSRHIEAVKNFPLPKKVLEIQRFLGLTNYFRKFIKDYASKVKPLTDLLKKSSTFRMDNNSIIAFDL